jgi:hypothetical protein
MFRATTENSPRPPLRQQAVQSHVRVLQRKITNRGRRRQALDYHDYAAASLSAISEE